MPAVGLTDHGSLAGAVAALPARGEAGRQADHRLRGLRLRRRVEAGEGLRAPDAPRRVERGLRQPDQARLSRLFAGLLLQAARRLVAARAALGRADRALRLPLGPRLEGARGDRARPTPQPTSTGSSRSSARTPPTSRSRTRGSTQQARINPLLAKLARGHAACRSSRPATSTTCSMRTRARTRRSSASSPGDSLKNPNHWQFDTDQFYFKTPAEMAHDFAGVPGAALAAHARGRRALQRRDRARRRSACRSSRSRRAATRSTTSSSCARKAWRSATTASTPEIQERLKFELKTIREMGFADYFLIVWDFVNFAKRNGDLGRPGPRLDRRLARRLLPRDHRRRPDPVRPPLRALPEPGPQVDARHGHRLLGRRPRPRHQLRGREVRARPRRPDHHLRDDDGARRRARRGPRARGPLRHGRQDREADPGRRQGLPRRLPEARARS